MTGSLDRPINEVYMLSTITYTHSVPAKDITVSHRIEDAFPYHGKSSSILSIKDLIAPHSFFLHLIILSDLKPV